MSKIKPQPVINKELCKECGGFCCNYQLRRVPLKELTPYFKDFFEAKAYDKKIVGPDIFYVLGAKCKFVTDEGCSLGEDRPDLCKDFPPRLDDEWVHFCPLMRLIYEGEK